MKKYIILKSIGLAILTIITLEIISFIEVAVYSYLINPGQAESVFKAHANSSAPYISGIFGFIVFFFYCKVLEEKRIFECIQIGNSLSPHLCSVGHYYYNSSRSEMVRLLFNFCNCKYSKISRKLRGV